MDNFGDPKVIGKVGPDIEEGKCGWLVIQALKKASPEQLEILKVSLDHSNPLGPVR